MLRIESGDHRIRAAVTLPGSKSISNRMLLLKAVLGVETELHQLSLSDDTTILLQSLELVAASKTATIDIGQAGTDMRFLTAYLATRPGSWLLTGSERMKQRPVAPLVNALRKLGAEIRYMERDGFPPLGIEGRQLEGGEVSIDGRVSSQFVSALLLVSPLLDGPLTINLEGTVVSRPYISMTLALMRLYGLYSKYENNVISVGRRRRKVLRSFEIESDWSSASYFYSICALAPDTKLELRSLQKKSLQADAVAADLFNRLGVATSFRASSVLISKTHEITGSFEHDFSDCPDIAQTVAATCFGLGIPARLSGLKTLRLKETDRIEALVTELTKLGATVTVSEDAISIAGKLSPSQGTQPVIQTYDDHRMAMSFAPLAVRCGQLFFDNGSVVSKSYPAFWQDLQALGFTVILQP